MWQEISTTEVKNAGRDITMDWYFLNAAGAKGLKELALKILQVNSDINSAVMQHVATQIMRSELFFKERNQMPWRVSGTDTVDKAMLERIARVGGSNKRQTGFYESYERANEALSHRNRARCERIDCFEQHTLHHHPSKSQDDNLRSQGRKGSER